MSEEERHTFDLMLMPNLNGCFRKLLTCWTNRETVLQEAILAARGNAAIVQMLLTGMMTNQSDTQSSTRSHSVINGNVDYKQPRSNMSNRPRYQFAEPQNKQSSKADPRHPGVNSAQAKILFVCNFVPGLSKASRTLNWKDARWQKRPHIWHCNKDQARLK